MKEVILEDLLKAGAHFGHQKSRWHPKMQPFIFGSRNNVYVIDLEKTKEKLEEAREFVGKLASEGKSVLFVSTKKQAKEIVKKAALESGMPYVVERWFGGTLTNFTSIRNLVRRLKKIREQKETGEYKKYTKKEWLGYEKELEKLERVIGGIEEMNDLPAAVFIVGVREEQVAFKEAVKKKVPIIALVDTNVDPSKVDYPIPANDDATNSIKIITDFMKEAIVESKKDAPKATEDKK